MALNGSGPISLAGATEGESIAVELGESATGTIALNDTIVRDLAEVSSGAITMPTDFWGKASIVQGGIWTWGYGAQGQIGDNARVNRSSPVQVGALTDWVDVAMSSEHTGGIRSNGTLWMWGSGYFGQLGIDLHYAFRSSPVQVGALTNWSQVSTGTQFSAAIKTTGSLYMWGRGTFGRLGNSNTTYRSSPVQVGVSTDWAQVSTAFQHSSAVKTNGTLWTWGLGTLGRLGHNDTISRSSPVQVGALSNWAQVSAGSRSAAATKTDGTLWTWGYGLNGRLGLNISRFIDVSSPTQVGTLTNWAQVVSGAECCIAIKTDGTIWGWGANGQGQLGIGNGLDVSSPVQIGALTNWAQPASGSQHSAAIKTDGTLWTWGNSSGGQTGQNFRIPNLSSPVQVGAFTTWAKVSAQFGGDGVIAIKQ
jgi:alpha-tubulin suppressor-like RCC1 family protein